MEKDQLYVILASIKPHFHDQSKGESTRLPGCPRISKWRLVLSEKKYLCIEKLKRIFKIYMLAWSSSGTLIYLRGGAWPIQNSHELRQMQQIISWIEYSDMPN